VKRAASDAGPSGSGSVHQPQDVPQQLGKSTPQDSSSQDPTRIQSVPNAAQEVRPEGIHKDNVKEVRRKLKVVRNIVGGRGVKG
jgi:hypothetical protein